MSEGARKPKSAAEILYQGHGSLRIKTPEEKYIYVDPFAGTDDMYKPAVDLIPMTHDHFDHTGVHRIQTKNRNCQIISWQEALADGVHQHFSYPGLRIQAVEAGNNPNHDIRKCVGFVITFSNGCSVYVSGDTSKTQQMQEMRKMQIDYAFFCCDGVYNMGVEEAIECAELVGARVNLPYHNETAGSMPMFDEAAAQRFTAPGRRILRPGEILWAE